MANSNINLEIKRIEVGELATIAQFHFNVSEPIHELKNIVKGLRSPSEMPAVILDLKKTNHPSMEAITALITTFSQISRIIGRVKIECEWRPSLFNFLYDIDFLRLSEELRIFSWDEEIFGGFDINKLNQFTKIICYREVIVQDRSDKKAIRELQDQYRLSYTNNVKKNCEGIFDSSNVDYELRQLIPEISMELIINSLIWGQNKVFFGAQRTRNNIKVCVCDAGQGFLNTITRRFLNKDSKVKFKPKDDVEAILIGCMMNKFENLEYGLADLITQIVNDGGTVFMSSNTAEIAWDKTLWNCFIDTILDQPVSRENFTETMKILNKFLSEQPKKSYRKISYFPYPLRGTRIVFKIPLVKTT